MFKYSVLIFVEKIYIKCNIWRVVVRPSYIWDARFSKVNAPESADDQSSAFSAETKHDWSYTFTPPLQ